MTYESIEQIQQANEALGHQWFSDDSMAWFNTEVHDHVYGGRYFITSEQDQDGLASLGRAWGGERRFSVRQAHDDGHISTVDGFGAYESLTDAVNAVSQLIERQKA